MLNADALFGELNSCLPRFLSSGTNREVKLHPGLKFGALELDRLDEKALIAIAHPHGHRRIHIASPAVGEIVEDDIEFPIAEGAIEFHDESRKPAALAHGHVRHLLKGAFVVLSSELDVAVTARKGSRDAPLDDEDLSLGAPLAFGALDRAHQLGEKENGKREKEEETAQTFHGPEPTKASSFFLSPIGVKDRARQAAL